MALIANNKGLGSAKNKKKTASTKLQQNIAKRSGTTTKKTTSTAKKKPTTTTKKVTPSTTTRTTTDPSKKVDQSNNTLKNVVEKITKAVTQPKVNTKPATNTNVVPTTNPTVTTPVASKPVTSTSTNKKSNGSTVSTNKTTTTKAPTSATQTVTTPTVNYQQLIDYFKEKNEAARQSAIDAITARVNAQRNAYNTQMDGLGDQYQALRNQSEVERYKTRSALREAQANRGQLNSGYGRQEQLLMDTQYGNAINSINMQEQSARNEIKNLIQQMEAEGEADKTEVNNNYASAVQQYIAQLQKDSQQ